jgi:hypothetical protein
MMLVPLQNSPAQNPEHFGALTSSQYVLKKFLIPKR